MEINESELNGWKIHRENHNDEILPQVELDHCPEPFPDELLSSFINRIAIANFAEPLLFIKKLENNKIKTPNYDWDLKIKDITLDKISKAIGREKSELFQMSLKPLKDIEEKIFNDLFSTKAQGKNIRIISRFRSIWFTDWSSRTDVYKNGLRYCPICLKNDDIPYFRISWRLGYIPFCSEHNCYLLNRCPSCGEPIAFYKIKWNSNLKTCYNCGHSLTDAGVKIIPEDDPLLNDFKNLLKNPNTNDIEYILALSWFIANNCGLYDTVFGNHKIIHDTNVIKNWQIFSNKANILPLFRNFEYSFLIIGTAIKLYHNKDLLNKFFKDYFTSDSQFFHNKPFYCDKEDCNYSTQSFGRLLVHRLHFNNVYSCDICFRMFGSILELNNHKNIHLNGTYNCNLCNINLNGQDELKKHMKLHSISKINICKVCGKSFGDKNGLNIHMKFHNDEKEYSCEICKKMFVTKAMLTEHMRIHTNERPFECEFCGQKFKQNSILNTHLKRHKDEKNYECNFCHKKFYTSTSLKSHLRIHTGEKPYVCKFCLKCFSESGSLKKHIRIHTGERPYKCDICKKTFTTKGSCDRHYKIHSNEKLYQCEICGKAFKRKDKLKRHSIVHNNKKMKY